MKKIVFCLCYLSIGILKSQSDSTSIKKVNTNISMEINSFSIGYGDSKKSQSKRQPYYLGSYLFSSYLPIYKNYSFLPIIGFEYYYWNDKFVTRDKYYNRELFYGIGLDKKWKLSSHSDIGFGIQKIYNIGKYESNVGTNTPKISYSDLFRLRITAISYLYKRIGLTSSLNFVAYDTDNTSNTLGSYRDINFSFGIVYAIKGGKKGDN
jgi:hypothetical protein